MPAAINETDSSSSCHDYRNCESLDTKQWMMKNQLEIITSDLIPKYSCSPLPSFSTDSLNPSSSSSSAGGGMELDTAAPPDGLQQISVDSVDSFLSWDFFNQLEEEIFFNDHYYDFTVGH